MSRLGRKPVKIPEGVEAVINGHALNIKGPKGNLTYQIPEGVETKIDDNLIIILSSRKKKEERILFGLARASIANLVRGVNRGFKKTLELHGVGFTALLEGQDLNLNLGYSHPVKLKKPEGIEIEIKKNEIIISGIEKDKVGQFAAHLRDLKRAEPYKGKGFRYSDEVVRRKVGKAALKTEGEGGK